MQTATRESQKVLEIPTAGVKDALALPDTPSVEWLSRTITEGQIQTLINTVAPKATLDELAVFFWTCKRRGLDPFLRQVHFVKRRRWNRELNEGKGGYELYAVHQTGIDGFRVIANRAKGPEGKPLLAGIKRGPLKDEKGNLIGAWAEVYRHDWKEPARLELDFDEYVQLDEKGNPTGLWKTKPQTMIEKCTEGATLRMALPEDLGDLYLHEELDNAEHIRPLNRTEQEPLNSSAVAKEDAVDAEITASSQESADPWVGEELPPDPVAELRQQLLAKIEEIRLKFPKPPEDAKWKKVCKVKCQSEDLQNMDPAVLSDFVSFLEKLQKGDKAAVGEARKILGNSQETKK